MWASGGLMGSLWGAYGEPMGNLWRAYEIPTSDHVWYIAAILAFGNAGMHGCGGNLMGTYGAMVLIYGSLWLRCKPYGDLWGCCGCGVEPMGI